MARTAGGWRSGADGERRREGLSREVIGEKQASFRQAASRSGDCRPYRGAGEYGARAEMRGAAIALGGIARTLVRRRTGRRVRVSHVGGRRVCRHGGIEPLEREKADGYGEQQVCGNRLHDAILHGSD